MAAGRWSYSYIRQLYEAGVIDGMTPTTFVPTGDVTRAQFVKMLARLQGADVAEYRSAGTDRRDRKGTCDPFTGSR